MNKQQRSLSRAINPVVFSFGMFFVAAGFSVVTCFSIFSAVGSTGSNTSVVAKAKPQAPVTAQQHPTSLAMVK